MKSDIPVLNLISDHLDRQVELRPDQDFLVQDDTRLSYAATKVAVDLMAKALMATGVERGDRVALIANPTPSFWIHFLAVTSVGAIWVGLNPKYTSSELDHVVSDAEPSTLFGFSTLDGASMTEELRRLMVTHRSLEHLVLFDAGRSDEDSTGLAVDDWLGAADGVSDADLADRRGHVTTLDPAFLVSTSGSTGRPKGALITHRGSNVCNVIAIERKGLADRRVICNLPINHVGAIGDICGRTMTGGGTLFFHERFSPEATLRAIEIERLNTIAGVPTMLQLCADHPLFETVNLSSVDLIAWGGAAIPAELLQRLIDKTGAPHCTMGYGMTEVTGGVTYAGLTDSVELLSTTVGTPDERQPLRIWHPEGREAEVGEAGEIQTKGDFVMAGYWRNPDATAAAFTDDGWFRTGDLALMRHDGYVQIVGRMSEMFKSGGYNVYPREVELALEEHNGVSMAAVVSLPDPTFQEVGVAYVMGDADIDPASLRSFAAERLANYKVPKRIHVLDELPMLPIGKVDKKALRALAKVDPSPPLSPRVG
ncbi:MAG: acyl--CoA ligase [Actinomycetia bacterium]|nr:acyl--CoA ligase [Actinomycetes bacterium]